MCHVAYSPKSRLFDPISGRFTPIRAANPRPDAEGATHSLIPKKPVTHIHLENILPPHPRRRPDQRTQTLPRWLLPETDNRIGKDGTGPDRNERSRSFSMAPNGAMRTEESRFFPARHPGYGPWGRARTDAWLAQTGDAYKKPLSTQRCSRWRPSWASRWQAEKLALTALAAASPRGLWKARQTQLFIALDRRWLSRDWHTPLPVWRGYRLAR